MSGLFTVLLAEKKHIDAIRQENHLFFEPFLESKELAFCEWNPEGQSLTEAVPGLLDTVGRRREWRIVVLNSTTSDTLKMQNPFDTVDKSALDAITIPPAQPGEGMNVSDWEDKWKQYYMDLAREKEAAYRSAMAFPLQKLATWLCFKPENYVLNDVKENNDAHDWAVQEINNNRGKSADKLEMLERAQYKFEQKLKECIRREFVADEILNIARPTEVQCISIRTANDSFFDPDDYWNVPLDHAYSSFADRNMYFDMMRFLVFDLLPQTHRDYRTDYIRFLATVLIFVSNPTPVSALQSRRLYRIETATDDTPLCTLVTSYDRKLAATSEVLDHEIEKIRGEIPGEMTDKAAEAMYCTDTEVSVLLDESCDFDQVYTEKNYGLYFDSPENEFHKWNRNHKRSEKALTYIAKQQLRSVKKSVSQMHNASSVTDVNVTRLTQLQLDDIAEYTDASEDRMVASIPPDLNDMSKYKERLNEESENVKKVLRRRMTKKTTLGISIVCLFLYMSCFLPFLLSNRGTVKSVSTAILMSAIMLVVLVAVMVVTLILLRSSLLKSVKGYNNAAGEVINDIQSSLKKFSKYLSALCSVRRGHKVQKMAETDQCEFTKDIRIRQKHKEDIRKKRAYIEENYGDFLAGRSYCDDTMSRPYDYDFDQKKEYAYPAPFLAGDTRQIEFISVGNMVTVPSSYVTHILVRMEGLYDR